MTHGFTPTRTPDEKAAACESLEEVEGFITEARRRGDDETARAGVRRRAELERQKGGR